MKLLTAATFAAATLVVAPAFGQLFEIGMEGCCDSGVNQWPGAEGPEHAIDGVGQKYLNFGEFATGVAVTPTAAGLTPTSITVYTANDEEPRDPTGFELYGLSGAVSGNPGDAISGLTLIVADALALPTERTEGGDTALVAANSSTVSFANDVAYDSYVIIFPDVKDSASANSMQIAEVQLNDATGAPLLAPGDTILGGQLVIPEPTAGLLAILGLAGLGIRRRR